MSRALVIAVLATFAVADASAEEWRGAPARKSTSSPGSRAPTPTPRRAPPSPPAPTAPSKKASKPSGYLEPCEVRAATAKAEGLDHLDKGEHATALKKFEESLACKQDPYVVQLAFLESCASRNVAKAKLYYGKFSPHQQARLKTFCDHQKPPIPLP